jgi:hypothetical protein
MIRFRLYPFFLHLFKVMLLAVILCGTISLDAQEQFKQNIRGKIIDKESKTPLFGANVYLDSSDPPMGAVTDEKGNYTIENVPIGNVTIKLSYLGYKPITIPNLRLTSGKELILNIELEEMVISGEEVVIVGKRDKKETNNKMASVSARSFNAEDTRRFAGSLNDPSRMAANFAGVGVGNDARNDIIIRGNSPMGLLWRFEGVDIPNPNHFASLGTTGGPISILNNNLLDKSDFFTGAFPAEYGNAMAGVFDLRMRSGNNQKREYMGQIGFNGFEFGAEGPFKKGYEGSYLINYRYSTLAAMKALGINFGAGQAVPNYQDVSFKLDLPTKKAGHFTLFGVGGISYIELLHDPSDTTDIFSVQGFDTYYGSEMGVIGASHRYFINTTTYTDFRIAASGSRQKIRLDSIAYDEDTRHLFFGDNSSEYKYTANFSVNKKINARNSLKTGVFFNYIGFDYADSVLVENNQFRTIRGFDGTSSLAQYYLQWQHKFSDELVLNTGVYSNYFNLTEELIFEPRIGMKWQFIEGQFLNIGGGMHSQRQPMAVYFYRTRLDPFGHNFLETNLNVNFSKSRHLVVGYERYLWEDFHIKTEAYYQELYDIPIRQGDLPLSMLNAGADFGTPGSDSLINEGTGRNYGIELTLEKHYSNQYYFLSTVSLFESKFTAADGIERNTVFNGNFVVNTLFGKEVNLNPTSSLSFDIRSVWAGGRRFVPIDLEASKLAGETVYLWDRAYEERYKDYFRFDFKITYRINHKKATQEWFIDLQNLTNRQNVFIQEYDPNAEQIKTTYQLGLFPMFNYRITF